MGIEISNLSDFPIDPENSLQVMQAMKDAIVRLQRAVADNFDPRKRNVRPPWVSHKLIRITGNTNLGAGWFYGRLQAPTPNVVLDPTQNLDLSKLYGDRNPNYDDCFVYDAKTSTLLQTNGKQYVWGIFTDYGMPTFASLSTSTTFTNLAGPRLPVFEVSSQVNWFILTGNATRPGMYTAKPLSIATTAIDPTVSSNLAQSDLGTQGSQSVYLLNTREIAVSGHALSSSTVPNVITGTYWGPATDGKPIFLIDECQ